MSESKNHDRIPVDPDHTTLAIARLFADIRAKFALCQISFGFSRMRR
jgi:hypothetical protein